MELVAPSTTGSRFLAMLLSSQVKTSRYNIKIRSDESVFLCSSVLMLEHVSVRLHGCHVDQIQLPSNMYKACVFFFNGEDNGCDRMGYAE